MNRTDGAEAGLSEKETLILARLSERALDGGALADTDELDLDDCREALEMLTLPSDHTLERLEVWLVPTTGWRSAARGSCAAFSKPARTWRFAPIKLKPRR